MSGNPKQSATAGPQPQRFPQSNPTYQPIQTPSRSDTFSVSNPQGSYAPPGQAPNQTPGLRGIPPGPPNQPSTPPNTDLKGQGMQSAPMNPLYMQQQVRQPGNFYTRAPSSQSQRMPNQTRPQQQMYTQQFIPTIPYLPMTNPAVQGYYQTQRQNYAMQPIPPIYSQPIPTSYQAYANPSQPATQFFFNAAPQLIRGPVPPPTTVPPNPTQSSGLQGTMPLVAPQQAPQQPVQPVPYQRQNLKTRRSRAIPIIDPVTGADKSNEIYDEINSSHPPSGESSARQTPPPHHNHSKEVQATIAKQVAAQAFSDTTSIEELHHDELPPEEHTDTFQPPPPQQAVLNPQRFNSIQSNLQINAKEFVSSVKMPSAKETPIVSANSNAAEVIIPNKVSKEKESPTKARKPKENSVKDYKESSKDSNNKSSPPVKEEQPQETNNVSPTPVVAPVSTAQHVPKENKENVNHEKRKNKNTPENKTPAAEPIVNTPPAAPQQTTAEPPSSNAKKQNAQKGGKQQSQQSNQKQQPSVPVPAPQPSKCNNRSNKKSELNMKGANKEGTDMDAFNDNAVQKEEVNANKVSNQNDVINANSITPPAQTQPLQEDISSTDEVKIPENNETTPNVNVAKTEQKAKVKSKESSFSVLDIVREPPKPVKPFIAPTVAENRDETDRANIVGDMVLVNNNLNSRNNANEVNDTKPHLNYPEGQWAPNRPDGKKSYEREFLLALRNLPLSRLKPENVPDVVLVDDRSRGGDVRLSMGRGQDFTNIPFTGGYTSKSGSQRGGLPKRNSQSKMGGGGSSTGPGKPGKPMGSMISISLKEDVKLHETKNAWKPSRLAPSQVLSEEEKKTDQLYKKVRSVLNKLTPQKFKDLVNQVRALEIDTKERLQGVIDLVFDKAVEEPNFSVTYADMCKELQQMHVPVNTDPNKKYSFKTLLVSRCQTEFERQSIDETERKNKVKIIEECTDPNKKKELEIELEEYDRRTRMRSVGIIRFIGELFKQKMLTANIMKTCLLTLLHNKDEESLECLCKLLTTVGAELESKNIDLDYFFKAMKEFVAGNRTKISSRIRFMLQDVIDLKESKWVPRRQDFNPKTMDQIQKEAENEHLNIQVMNSMPMTPRKDDRGGGGERRSRKNMSEDGWMMMGNSNRNKTHIFEKMRNKMPQSEEHLGDSSMFSTWSRGSNCQTSAAAPTLGPTQNMFTALDPDRPYAGGSRGSKGPYSSKGPSLERGYKFNDGRGSRSGSQHRSDSSHRSMPPPQVPQPAKQPVQQEPPRPPKEEELKDMRPPDALNLTPDQIERRLMNSLEEYLGDSCSIEEYFQEVVATVAPSYLPTVVEESLLFIIERNEVARIKTGQLFSTLVKLGKLPLKDFCQGLEKVLAQADDLQIDIPKVWDYIAQNLVHSVCEEVLTFDKLHKCMEVLIENNNAGKVLAPLFKLIISDKGPNFLHSIWVKAGKQLSDFMPSSQVPSFVKENNLELLTGGNAPVGQNKLSWEQIQSKLSEFFKKKASFDDVGKWISANVGNRVEDNKFIRVLATAIFEDSIERNKLVEPKLTEHSKFFQKYVDNKLQFELQCLYALQALIHRLEHPQGLLLSICDKLYEDGTFSQESFIQWESSTDPAEQEGKGVALKQLTSFFTQMKENDEEDEEYIGSSSSSASDEPSGGRDQ